MYTFPMRQISYQATRTNSAKGDICAEIYLINECQDVVYDFVPAVKRTYFGNLWPLSQCDISINSSHLITIPVVVGV